MHGRKIVFAAVVLGAALVVAAILAGKKNAAVKPKRGVNFALDGRSDVRLAFLSIDVNDAPAPEDCEGTVWLSFRLTRSDKEIIKVAGERSRITAFADDRGTDFLKRRPKAQEAELPEVDGEFAYEPHKVDFSIQCDRRPAVGATRLMIRADVALLCGVDRREVQTRRRLLRKGLETQAGPFRLKVTEFRVDLEPGEKPNAEANQDEPDEEDEPSICPPKVWLTLRWPEIPTKRIRTFRVLDPRGREARAFVSHPDEVRDEKKRVVARTTRIGIRRNVTDVSLVVTYYDRLAEVLVPIQVNTGLGF